MASIDVIWGLRASEGAAELGEVTDVIVLVIVVDYMEETARTTIEFVV